jgi:hypothetical protein
VVIGLLAFVLALAFISLMPAAGHAIDQRPHGADPLLPPHRHCLYDIPSELQFEHYPERLGITEPMKAKMKAQPTPAIR